MIGIVILNYNTPYETIKCVDSIFQHTRSDFHIIVVDNNSTDDSIEIFRKRFFNIKSLSILPLPKNVGYSKGNNEGIGFASDLGCSEFLVINSDVVLLNQAIDLMTSKIQSDPNIKIIGPSVRSIDNSETQKLMKPLNFKRLILNFKPFSMVGSINDRFIDFNEDADYTFQGMVYGCCFMFKNDILINGKLFDEKMFLYYEEDALADRFVKQEYFSFYSSQAKVLHLHSASISKRASSFERFHRFLSALYVLKNYGNANRMQIQFFSIYISLIMFYILVVKERNLKKYNRFLDLIQKIIHDENFEQIKESMT